MHAPKTDTPAAEDFGCPRCSIGTAIFGDSCIVCVNLPDAHAALIKEIQAKRALAESTLAAERASRLQAEEALKEASDALIAYQFQPVARILRARRIIDGALAKPSVSPEQAVETK